MSKQKIEQGMDTEAIKTLLRFSCPPHRQEGEGISITEWSKTMNIGKSKAKKMLFERDDLTPVIMMDSKNIETIIFIPSADAKEKYPDWIIENEN